MHIILIIRLILQLTSCLSYVTVIYICFRYRMTKLTAIWILIALCACQFIFIFFPLMLVPFFTTNSNPNERGYIQHNYCQFEGSMLNFGWLSVTFLSIWLTYFMKRISAGQKQDNQLFVKAAIIGIVIFGIFQAIAYSTIGYEEFFWHFQGQPYYMICSCDSVIYKYLELVVELTSMLFWIYLYVELYQQKKIIEQNGLNWEDAFLNIQVFGLAQIVLWTINLIVKWIEKQYLSETKFLENYIIVDILWQILNLLYDIEGVIVLHLFLAQYRTFLRRSLPIWMYKVVDFNLSYILCCFRCCRQSNVFNYNNKKQILLYSDSHISDSSKNQLSLTN